MPLVRSRPGCPIEFCDAPPLCRKGCKVQAQQEENRVTTPTTEERRDDAYWNARQKIARCREQQLAEAFTENKELRDAVRCLLRELKNCVWLLEDLQPQPGLVQKQARAVIADVEGQPFLHSQRG